MLYVGEKAAEAVRVFEDRFKNLHPSIGVLFVSVLATPVEGGDSSEFIVRLGLKKGLTKDAGEAIIQSTLRRELAAGLKVLTAVYFGVSGAARDDSSDAGAHQTPA